MLTDGAIGTRLGAAEPPGGLAAPWSYLVRPELRSFAADGFAGPVRLLDRDQCRLLARHLERTEQHSPPEWKKGRAAVDGLLARIAAHPAMLALITPLLGPDVILWGASAVRQRPGWGHAWHVDSESADGNGRFISAWIGLENVTPKSGLRLIAGSHLCGRTVQQAQSEAGLRRGEPTDQQVLDWARVGNSDSRLAVPATHDGDVILFDGRIWHGSVNQLDQGERVALLLQFASADTPVRIPDPDRPDWPFAYLDSPRPPVIAVAGLPRSDLNRVVPMQRLAPVAKAVTMGSTVRDLAALVRKEPITDWHPFPIFRGSTPALDLMSCHAAALNPGFSPHPPHAHGDEELLIILEGEAELLVAEKHEMLGARAIPVSAGDFAYYPAHQHHTIRNSADRPVRYLMFRWNRTKEQPAPACLETLIYRAPEPVEASTQRRFVVRPVFEGPTRWLRKLHCHMTRLEPGAGYAPHADPYDVAILVRSGELETVGRKVGAGGLVFYPAGEIHGMRNVGTEPAHYLVFEWHGAPVAVSSPTAGGSTRKTLAIA